MKVTLVATVLNAADQVDAFLHSIAAQTRPPDEVIVCDGGSRDGTLELLRNAVGITLVQAPGANIARGRNTAIAAATHDVIAVSDADCILEARWLEELLRPLEAGADVAMGFYQPLADGFLQTCTTSLNLPDANEIDEATFMPRSRSVAFRREALEAVGGYPEWLDIGEDMVVNHRWRELGLDMRFVPDAVVRWRPRPNLSSTWTQYFRYARGDAIAGMYPERHALRFAVYSGALLAWSSRRRSLKLLTLVGGAAYAWKPLNRAFASLSDPGQRVKAAVAVPALMALVDVAKMAGYLAGLPKRAGSTPYS